MLNAGRERDRMAGATPEAGADIQDRRNCVGRTFKTGGTALEGHEYEFMTGHDTIVSDELKECLP